MSVAGAGARARVGSPATLLYVSISPLRSLTPRTRAPRPRQSIDGEWYTATYSTSSPLLRGVKVLLRNRTTQGVRRVRRAKLTDLLYADPNKYLVDENTKEASLLLAEKQEKRRLARLGGKKKSDLRSAAGGKTDKATGGDDKKAAAAPAGKAAAPAAKPAAKAAAPKK